MFPKSGPDGDGEGGDMVRNTIVWGALSIAGLGVVGCAEFMEWKREQLQRVLKEEPDDYKGFHNFLDFDDLGIRLVIDTARVRQRDKEGMLSTVNVLVKNKDNPSGVLTRHALIRSFQPTFGTVQDDIEFYEDGPRIFDPTKLAEAQRSLREYVAKMGIQEGEGGDTWGPLVEAFQSQNESACVEYALRRFKALATAESEVEERE